MVSLNSGIQVIKPDRFSVNDIKVDLKKLFTKLAEAVIHGALTKGGKPDALPTFITSVLGTLDAFDKKTPLESIAWTLIYRSLSMAVSELVLDAAVVISQSSTAIKILDEQCDVMLDEAGIIITDNFFENPKGLPLLPLVQAHLKSWGKIFGLNEAEAQKFESRLPPYFVAALSEEWRNNSIGYQPLADALQNPFGKATQTERDWLAYGAWLQKQIALPMFEEVFSLADVYVPLRAYYQDQPEEEPTASSFSPEGLEKASKSRTTPSNKVVHLHDEIMEWLNSPQLLDPIRIVSGGPGSGKSSFLKKLAADLSDGATVRPIYIPLQRFSLSTDFRESVGRFLRDTGFFKETPLDGIEAGSKPVILLLDGLDELTKPGAMADEVARDFLIELQRSIHLINTQRLKCLAIVTGRTIAIQKTKTAIRQCGKQQLYVMKYFYRDVDRKKYGDPKNLLKIDQRREWWSKYASAKGLPAKIPANLLDKELEELSAEPLLNYLLVLSGFHKEAKRKREINRNSVYRRLLGGVHKRQYESGRFKPTQALNDDDFSQIMETIAVAAWYGDGRTATVEDIREKCTTRKLREILDTFLSGATGGINRLVAAFYFQAAENVRRDEAFEFTHKTFGEYLTARRIVRALERIARDFLGDQSERETPFDENQALKAWAALCGQAAMDLDLARFIRDEIAMDDWTPRLAEWQTVLEKLIRHAIKSGMPTAKEGLPFAKAYQHARNSEETLWLVANSCARQSGNVLRLGWPFEHSAGEILHRLRGQRWPPESSVIVTSLSYTDFDNQNLVVQDLYFGDFTGSSLVGAKLIRAELGGASLANANLSGAKLHRADLFAASLVGADLSGADATNARLTNSYAKNAKFSGANLKDSDLTEGVFDKCVSDKARFDGALLRDSSFCGASFRSAAITAADLGGSDFANANFDAAKLHSVDFSGANLIGASFEGAEVIGCNFYGSFLNEEALGQATVEDIDLSKLARGEEYQRKSAGHIRSEITRRPQNSG